MYGRKIVVNGHNFEWIVAGCQQFFDLDDFYKSSQNGAFHGVVIWDLENNRRQYKAPLNEIVDTLRYPVLPSDVAAWIRLHIVGGVDG